MRTFALIGRSLAHSFSRTYFTQKFAELGLSDCRYELFELPEIGELPALLARHPDLAGLNVTIPYKEQIQPYLTWLAPSAARVGAVNVVEIQADGSLTGHNTDYVGFRKSLRQFYPGQSTTNTTGGANGARALVLGTGGAAKAVVVALSELGIVPTLVGRNPRTSDLTYGDLSADVITAHPLLINTTPLGTYPATDECPPLPYAALTPAHYLFDLIYNPAETLFLRRGQAAGAHVHNGAEMLRLQAEAAWDIWTG